MRQENVRQPRIAPLSGVIGIATRTAVLRAGLNVKFQTSMIVATDYAEQNQEVCDITLLQSVAVWHIGLAHWNLLDDINALVTWKLLRL